MPEPHPGPGDSGGRAGESGYEPLLEAPCGLLLHKRIERILRRRACHALRHVPPDVPHLLRSLGRGERRGVSGGVGSEEVPHALFAVVDETSDAVYGSDPRLGPPPGARASRGVDQDFPGGGVVCEEREGCGYLLLGCGDGAAKVDVLVVGNERLDRDHWGAGTLHQVVRPHREEPGCEGPWRALGHAVVFLAVPKREGSDLGFIHKLLVLFVVRLEALDDVHQALALPLVHHEH
mmetsp:Transcript_59478/g.141407  ORF Transcript_59478/g.141407 Transcript_59478/m.141407 type:complete len:235 (-) Transcript_59478:17-721(-)